MADLDTSNFAKKIELASLKPDADELYVDKLQTAPCDLNSLKNKVDKSDIDKLVPAPTYLKNLRDVVDGEVQKCV